LRPRQVRFPFSVVHVPVVYFDASIPGFGAATPSDRSSSVQSNYWHPLPPGSNGKPVWRTDPAHGKKHLDQHRSNAQPGSQPPAVKRQGVHLCGTDNFSHAFTVWRAHPRADPSQQLGIGRRWHQSRLGPLVDRSDRTHNFAGGGEREARNPSVLLHFLLQARKKGSRHCREPLLSLIGATGFEPAT